LAANTAALRFDQEAGEARSSGLAAPPRRHPHPPANPARAPSMVLVALVSGARIEILDQPSNGGQTFLRLAGKVAVSATDTLISLIGTIALRLAGMPPCSARVHLGIALPKGTGRGPIAHPQASGMPGGPAMLAARFAPEALVWEQENATETIGQNRNEPERERQGARCGWVPCPPNFLPGYQGSASWRGAFLVSVTTDGSVPRAAPKGQARSLGMYRFLRDVDARS